MEHDNLTIIPEVKQKKSISIKLRKILIRQLEKYKSYRNLLEQEEKAIIKGDTDKIEVYIQLEHSIIREIYSIQKIIHPLEKSFFKVSPENEELIEKLHNSIEQMRKQVLLKNKSNRILLKKQLTFLKQEINSLRVKIKSNSHHFNLDTPAVVDITR